MWAWVSGCAFAVWAERTPCVWRPLVAVRATAVLAAAVAVSAAAVAAVSGVGVQVSVGGIVGLGPDVKAWGPCGTSVKDAVGSGRRFGHIREAVAVGCTDVGVCVAVAGCVGVGVGVAVANGSHSRSTNGLQCPCRGDADCPLAVTKTAKEAVRTRILMRSRSPTLFDMEYPQILPTSAPTVDAMPIRSHRPSFVMVASRCPERRPPAAGSRRRHDHGFAADPALPWGTHHNNTPDCGNKPITQWDREWGMR